MKLCCATICWPHSREFLCFRSMVSRTMVESPARYHLDQASSLSPGWSQVQALQPAFTFSHFVADGLFQLMTLGSSTLRQVITAQLLAVGTRYKICDQLLLITWPTWVATWVATWVEPGQQVHDLLVWVLATGIATLWNGLLWFEWNQAYLKYINWV